MLTCFEHAFQINEAAVTLDEVPVPGSRLWSAAVTDRSSTIVAIGNMGGMGAEVAEDVVVTKEEKEEVMMKA